MVLWTLHFLAELAEEMAGEMWSIMHSDTESMSHGWHVALVSRGVTLRVNQVGITRTFQVAFSNIIHTKRSGWLYFSNVSSVTIKYKRDETDNWGGTSYFRLLDSLPLLFTHSHSPRGCLQDPWDEASGEKSTSFSFCIVRRPKQHLTFFGKVPG